MRLARIVASTIAALVTASALHAQVTTATLYGVVRDATGRGLPGATVTATNLATKDSRSATTADDGSFSLTIATGTHEVSISATGFRTTARVVEIAAAASNQLDVALDALLSEAITVTATKREQTVLNVPFSVVAATEEVLRSRGVQDIEGVAANVGGLTVQNT